MKIVPTGLPGVVIVEPAVHRDDRGFFLEVFQAEKFAAAGLPDRFWQDNHSASKKGALRGLHLQVERPQGKLVRCIVGEVYDVAVDVRVGSPTFGKWFGLTLSAENFRQLWVPVGFAHGYCVVSEWAEVEYRCTAFYHPASEVTVRWDDPAIGVPWPVGEPILSPRDAAAPPLAALVDRLPRFAP